MQSRRSSEPTAHVEAFQSAFEGDVGYEAWIVTATRTFETPEPGLSQLFDDRIRASPTSFAPYLARGRFRVSLAYAKRGSNWAQDTHASDFAAMNVALEQADIDGADGTRWRLLGAPA